MELNELSHAVIGAAMEVHKILGPGLLEASYQKALLHELHLRSIPCRCEVLLPITYKGLTIENAYRIDILVADTLIIELKAIEKTLPIHKAQLLTYLTLTSKPLGLLINFNTSLLKDGVTRVINSKHTS
ncbi:GxxExxY protein [Roseibacillus persicicus]|uniref:GxxExxY protein n=1 Tax=Roseibacillus persicicus TaxID=454148 RepID=UPI0028102EA9|nr:GxxExxY protein [Roseibacillus persicicus]MDQ8189575.1 GxxExxY protein [Roseibacillus persicicus]